MPKFVPPIVLVALVLAACSVLPSAAADDVKPDKKKSQAALQRCQKADSAANRDEAPLLSRVVKLSSVRSRSRTPDGTGRPDTPVL